MESARWCDLFSKNDWNADYSCVFFLLKKKLFSSWDQFLVPYPGGQAIYIWGNPIWVDSTSSREALEGKRLELEQVLVRITVEADAAVSKIRVPN